MALAVPAGADPPVRESKRCVRLILCMTSLMELQLYAISGDVMYQVLVMRLHDIVQNMIVAVDDDEHDRNLKMRFYVSCTSGPSFLGL